MATRGIVTPMVSVITPARAAAATLERTFLSVAQQAFASWEHIVVTHPEDRGTEAIAHQRAVNDHRVIHLSAANETAAAARNHGLDHARGRFVLFLDADDTVSPGHCRRLVRHAQRTRADVVLTGYRRVASDGTTVLRRQPAGGPVERSALVQGPPTALHALLFRRDLLQRIGAFDAALVTNEDWDLCVRAAAQGATFSARRGCSAEYWTTPGSLSTQAVAMVRDRVEVVRRARRLGLYDENGAEQGLEEGIALDVVYSALWAGALCIAREQGTQALLAELGELMRAAPSSICSEQGTAALLEGLVIGFGCRHDQVEERLRARWRALEVFVCKVGETCQAQGLQHSLMMDLEQELARLGKPDRARWINESRLVPVVSDMLARMMRYERARQVILRLALVRPRSLATFSFAPAIAQGRRPLPLVYGRLAMQLADQLQSAEGWIERVRDRVVRIATVLRRRLRRLSAREADRDAGSGEPENPWEEIFETENPWHYHRRYEQAKYERTLALLPSAPIGRALELACAEGHFTQLIAPRVAHLTASDISPTALSRCRARCHEQNLDNVEFLELDFFNQPIEQGWDLIVSSEVLYYMASREKLADYAHRVVQALNEGGLFLHAHAYEVSDTPDRTGFDWGDEFAAGTICETLAATPGLVLEGAVETEVYRCEVYRKHAVARASVQRPAVPTLVSVTQELDPALAADVVWNGSLVSRSDAEAERHYRIPVLMYHAVAPDGPAGLAPWRITPEAFEHQLRFLRRRGYRSVGLEEWERARGDTAALSGRPVMLTFDDGYENFAEHAWPVLKRNGFGALQFITSGAVGGRADWDSAYGDPYRLMDWSTLASLVEEGLEVGSHCHEHRRLDRLTFDEIAFDAQRSRETFGEALGQVPRTIAAPYGICSLAHGDVLQAAGFERVFLASGGKAPVRGPRLRTPRLEVDGAMTIEAFAELIGASDPPEPADRP